MNAPANEYLNVQMLGFEECTKSKLNRKHTFEGNSLHFILSGKGYIDGIQIGKNDCFMIKKGHLAEYFPDSNDPWTYCWINFDGKMADKLLETTGLNTDVCTFSIQNTDLVFNHIKSAIDFNYQSTDVTMHINAVLLEIFASLATIKPELYTGKTESVRENRVKRSIEYITKHYKEKDCIATLSKVENVNKRYLSRLFKEHSDLSPQGHMIKLRIEEAKILLKTRTYPINAVGEAVGYDDVLQFSKIFKKHTGMSPTQYRNL